MTLLEKQTLFASLVPRLLSKALELGFQIRLGEVERSHEQARLNAQKGSGISHSLHLVSLAIDLNLYRNGVYLDRSEDYQELGNYWKTLSGPDHECCWGGDFKDEHGNPKPDGDHFSIAHDGRK